MSYLLDADVLIQAHKLHYGFDFCPGFWDWIVRMHQRGEVHSILAIRNDIATGGDQLADWVNELDQGFFLQPDSMSLEALGSITDWVDAHKLYSVAAKQEFMTCSDLHLIAHALAHRMTIVTMEVSAPNSKNRVKIPDVCNAMNVKSMPSYELLRTLKARFVASYSDPS